MKKAIHNFCIILFFLIFNFSMELSAQVSRSAYFMDHLPIANTLNPSFHPPNNFFIDLPLISSLYISADGPFSYAEITSNSTSDDKVYLDKYKILSTMNPVETISFDFKTEIGKFGFKAGNHFFSFNASKVVSTDISLERNLMEFLLFGNGNDKFLGKEVLFSKSGFNATYYHELGAAWAFNVNDKFTFGLRMKYLNGVMNVMSKKAEMTLYTDPDHNYALSASTDLIIQTASAIGYIDELDFSDPMDYMFMEFSNNHGYGGDIGIAYQPVPKMNLSASVIDLGMIHWNDYVKSYKSKYPNEKYTFEGFDLSDLINGGNIADSITILDSLDEHFRIVEVNENYTSYLTPKAYFGVTYNVSKHDQFGFLIRGKFPQNNLLTSYTLNYRRTFGDVLAVFINYTIKQNSNQVGFGLSLRAGPVMLYAMNDVVDAFFQPAQVKGYNVQFGISMVFGKPYRKQLPLEEKLMPENESVIDNTEGPD
jgi:hypothetical protein